MSRSFRATDAFDDKRAAFAERRANREARRAEFAALGYDDPDALADLPAYSPRRREMARRALNA